MDTRLNKLANTIVNHSLKLKKGSKVFIKAINESKELVWEIIEECNKVGAYPFVEYFLDDTTARLLAMYNDEEKMNFVNKWNKYKWEDMDAEVIIDGSYNEYEFSEPIILEKSKMSRKINKELNDMITQHRKWVLLEWPTPLAAHKAGKPTEVYSDFVFDVCNVDYKAMYEACVPLKELMEKTDKVHIVGSGTDLTFSIKDIPAVICAGECNIPDGEVFTAPVKNSVNGFIQYNTDSPYDGKIYKNIRLEFKDGKIVNATCENGDNESLNKIFDSDEGSRYVGEFALGLNPLINEPVGSILFDEKIWGSFHFTPGQCYKGEAENGNDSIIHWDLVCMQGEGGEIYFDDVLIRKNGRFVLKELEYLNYNK